MHKKLIIICLLLLFNLSVGFAMEEMTKEAVEPGIEENIPVQGIPVLMYHHLLPESMLADEPFNAAIISFESFKEQMKWLHENGWTALSLEDFHQAMTSEDPLPEKSFVITFDDGYASNLFFAFPTLNRYGFPAAEFIITANLEEDTRKWNGKKLSWKDAQAISKIFSIQSHSHGFHQIEDGQPLLSIRSQEEIKADLDFAWQEIDRHIEPGLRAFAYPYGVWSETAIHVLKEQNVQLAFTTKEGYASKDSDLLLIPRFSITPSVNIDDFKAIFEPELHNSQELDSSEESIDTEGITAKSPFDEPTFESAESENTIK